MQCSEARWAPSLGFSFGSRAWVSLDKLGSWFLLLLISYALVTIVNRPQAASEETAPNGKRQPTSA
jgi:uncharacterized membrane protein YoaT (DUF817 family)